jgi:type I restriction enzyme M protein
MAAEGRIRENILRRDYVEAVVGLAPNLFYGTGLAACILIIRQRKPEDRRGKVAFIDASTLFKRGRNQNTLEPEHADQILIWYRDFIGVSGYVTIVDLKQIEANDWNLNIPLYVDPLAGEETPTLAEALADLERAFAQVEAAEVHLRDLLRDRGLQV